MTSRLPRGLETRAARWELQTRVLNAVSLIHTYGGDDGAHHKQWVIDQVLRTLLADDYEWFCEQTGWSEEYHGVAP